MSKTLLPKEFDVPTVHETDRICIRTLTVNDVIKVNVWHYRIKNSPFWHYRIKNSTVSSIIEIPHICLDNKILLSRFTFAYHNYIISNVNLMKYKYIWYIHICTKYILETKKRRQHQRSMPDQHMRCLFLAFLFALFCKRIYCQIAHNNVFLWWL